MNSELELCCLNDGEQPGRQITSARIVPWFEGAKPMWSSTIARVSGQKRKAQRGSIPPWLWPMIESLRPARAWMLRIALTTYSPAIWMSPIPLPGTSTVHHGIPSALSAGCQFQE